MQGNLGVERSETLNRPFDFCKILVGRSMIAPTNVGVENNLITVGVDVPGDPLERRDL